jgi:hypothetical protein
LQHLKPSVLLLRQEDRLLQPVITLVKAGKLASSSNTMPIGRNRLGTLAQVGRVLVLRPIVDRFLDADIAAEQ